jgi:uncharacterized protein (TIGR03437 family)
VTGTASVQVFLNGAGSNTLTAAAAANAPGIFPIIVKGANYPAGVFPDGEYVGDPAISAAFRKARPGDAIQLFATGLVPVPAGVLPGTQGVSGVTVTIGSITVPATFARLLAYHHRLQSARPTCNSGPTLRLPSPESEFLVGKEIAPE